MQIVSNISRFAKVPKEFDFFPSLFLLGMYPNVHCVTGATNLYLVSSTECRRPKKVEGE